MNKQAVRITQFVINSILTFVSFTSAILVFLLLVPLAITALISFLVHNWSFFWNFLVIVAILLGVAFFIETLSFKLPEMFGKFFEEEKEDEDIRSMKTGTTNGIKKNTKNTSRNGKNSRISKGTAPIIQLKI